MLRNRSIVNSIRKRMGVMPPFFHPVLDSPEAMHQLWLHTQFAWVDNPLPELVKEKILAVLSRLDSVVCCRVAHCCSLHSMGMSGSEILELLSPPASLPPSEADFAKMSDVLVLAGGIKDYSSVEDILLQASDWVFHNTRGSNKVREQVRRILGPEMFIHWLSLLSFGRMRNDWIETHPDAAWALDPLIEQSLDSLIRDEPRLADYLGPKPGRGVHEVVCSRASTSSGLRPCSQINQLGELLANVVDSSPDFIAVIDAEGRTVFVNQAVRRALGFADNEDVSCIAMAWTQPGSVNAVFTPSRIAVAIDTGTWSGENVISTRDGREIPVSQVIVAHKGVGGTVQYLSTIARDITQQKRAEEALEHSERRFRALMDNSEDGVAMINADQRFIYCSASATRILGRNPSEIFGRRFSDFVHQDDLERLQAALQGILSVPGKGVNLALRMRKNGQVRRVEGSLMNCLHDSSLGAVIVSFRDETARYEAEQALAESEQRFRILIENAPFGVRIARLNMLLYANPAYVRQFGYSDFSELAGKSVLEVVSPQRRAGIAAELAELEHGTSEGREWLSSCLRRDGTEFPAHVAVRRIHLSDGPAVVAFVTDLTERHLLDDRFARSQRLDVIGKLAGGIAHDFNNLLTIMHGHCELLMESDEISDSTRDYVEGISAVAQQGAALTDQLLTFGQSGPIQLVPLDLHGVIGDVLRSIEPSLHGNISVTTKLARELPMVSGDRELIELVLVNLVANAQDALPEGGVIFIRTEIVVLDHGYPTRHPEAYAGKFVRLRVAENGSGSRNDNFDRIYEPFFRTRKVGYDAGLGLATAYGAVKQHKGWIEVGSKLDEGTVFDVFLPAESSDESAQSEGDTVMQLEGHETVLIVEDEASLRRLLAHALNKQGYNVLEAELPASALDIWKEKQDEINLVITDIVMPGGQNGWDMARILFQDRADLKILFMSGYFGDLPPELQVDESNFIRKPFLPKDMLSRVRELLDKK